MLKTLNQTAYIRKDFVNANLLSIYPVQRGCTDSSFLIS